MSVAMPKATIATNPILKPAQRPRERREPEYLGIEDRAPETVVRRVQDMIRNAASMEEYATQYGGMKLRGELNEAQFQACKWLDGLHDRYLKAIDAKSIRSVSLEPSSKAEPPDPIDSELGQAQAKREAATEAEFISARLAGMAAGRDEWYDFMHTVVSNVPPSAFVKMSVRTVADALVVHRRQGSRFRRSARK